MFRPVIGGLDGAWGGAVQSKPVATGGKVGGLRRSSEQRGELGRVGVIA
jgi:hypothetical protein